MTSCMCNYFQFLQLLLMQGIVVTSIGGKWGSISLDGTERKTDNLMENILAQNKDNTFGLPLLEVCNFQSMVQEWLGDR